VPAAPQELAAAAAREERLRGDVLRLEAAAAAGRRALMEAEHKAVRTQLLLVCV
jgi:hypothetical protein